ncbi:hypothetical protein DY000_02035603 [Brassica cretica]|uniref:Uncharacterized protein n=1 Tax=Brassica cretica TaxID=69181 RepID=A0ABQ7DF43_BRACR|nr:hypothetical protein DY000_02035603 [Brassica cretica]
MMSKVAPEYANAKTAVWWEMHILTSCKASLPLESFFNTPVWRVGICIYMDLTLFRVRNPPPATLMLISDELEHTSPFLSADQQRCYYNLVLARTYTPPSMSCLYHTAEWLWQTLLARS